MKCFYNISLKTVMRCLCLTGLLLLLAGHVTTLALAYHHHEAGQDDGKFGEQLLIGGLILCSVLPLLALSCLLPEKAEILRRAWLAVHLTWNDDLARHAVLVMYDLQVKPVVDALELTSLVAEANTLDYWWWSLQGLLLVVLASRVSGSGDEGESEDEDEAPDELTEVVLGGEEVQAIQSPAGALRLPDRPAPAVYITEIKY